MEVVKPLRRKGDKDDDQPMTKWEIVDDDDTTKNTFYWIFSLPPHLINTNLHISRHLNEGVCVCVCLGGIWKLSPRSITSMLCSKARQVIVCVSDVM